MDMRAVIDQTVADVRNKYGDRQLAISLDLPEGPVTVQADDLLNDLVLNLMDNAIKFCSRPEVEVDLSVAVDTEKGVATIKVADRGPGIPDEDKDQVFFRFVRRREEPEGTGLGLSLVMALVERYNGHIWIEDRVADSPDEGAVFVIELPLA
jgi:signal transduction histidine kinase